MKKRRFFAGFAAAAIAASMMAAVPASAADTGGNYGGTITETTSNSSKATITKYLLMKSDANVPNISMNYTVAKADSSANEGAVLQAASATAEYNIYNGITTGVKMGTGAVGSSTTSAKTNQVITFSSSSASANASSVGIDTTTLATYTKAVQEQFTIDFSGVTFTEPGIYRYTITEYEGELVATADDYAAVSALDNTARTVDVVVEDNSESTATVATDKNLKITRVNVYDDVITATTNTYDPLDTSGTALKSSAFNNKYETHDFTFTKTVAGNQGSKDKYFKFVVTVSGANSGDTFTIVNGDGTNANTAISTNTATTYDSMSNPGTITADASGVATGAFYIQHGQSIVVQGIADNASVKVVETPEDYTPAITVDTTTGLDADGTVNADKTTYEDTALTADGKITYTNTKTGTIPTGVILAIAGPSVVGVAVVGGIIYLTIKKKREEAEN